MIEDTNRRETICTIDDDVLFARVLKSILSAENYNVVSFSSAQSFLEWQADNDRVCDLIITDLSMPHISGYDLCKKIRSHQKSKRVPIIVVTGIEKLDGKVLSLEHGADDFIQKPFRRNELVAKIQSLLNIQRHEGDRLRRMARFVSPNIANLLLSDHKHHVLSPHQAEVTVLFIDLRGFTAFSENYEPDVVMQVLNAYYNTVGCMMIKHNATLGSMAGDGFMLFLNDPEPIPKHREATLDLALDLRAEMSAQKKDWVKKSYDLNFGIGIADGKATIGGIGFDQFWQYTVIGHVANLASRICQLATDGQILVSRHFLKQLEMHSHISEPVGSISLKGIYKTIDIHNVVSTNPY